MKDAIDACRWMSVIPSSEASANARYILNIEKENREEAYVAKWVMINHEAMIQRELRGMLTWKYSHAFWCIDHRGYIAGVPIGVAMTATMFFVRCQKYPIKVERRLTASVLMVSAGWIYLAGTSLSR